MNHSGDSFHARIRWAQQLAEKWLGRDKRNRSKNPEQWRRTLVLSVPYFWLTLVFLIPFGIIFKIALSNHALAMPPYEPLFVWANGRFVDIKVTLANFAFVIADGLYLKALLHSMLVAAVATVLTLLIAYPLAYAMARADRAARNVLLLMVILPFWTSFLLRVYAWIGLLKNNGVINNILLWLNIIDTPITMLQTDFAIYIGIVYSYLPFMVLPLYSTLEKMDVTLLEAAADLGCRPAKAFLKITLPLSMPGVIAGSMLVFIPAIGEYVIPELLGGPNSLMIGKVLWSEFFLNRDWPVACAVAIGMLLVLVVPLMFFQRVQAQHRDEARRA
jgi:putrescine transport system permease protein